MKHQTKSSLTRKLDKEVSRIVRARGMCEFCSMTDYEKLQCCHIFSRTYRNTRWDLNNLLCLCASCHFKSHRNPIDFTESAKQRLGEYEYTQLRIRHNAIKRYTLQDMQSLLTILEALK